MALKDNAPIWQPTREQELLLRAALLDGDSALAAWNQWKSDTDIEYLDGSSYRVLPLLYRNMQKHGVNEPLMERLKSVYRHTWSKNQMLLNSSTRVLRAFHDRGIETVALKGVALVSLYFKDWGVRPMSDFDVLVPTLEAQRAIRLLGEMGWRSGSRWPDRLLKVRNGSDFTDPMGRSLDLHWHLLWECCQPDADDDFWEAAISTEIGDVSTSALCPADQLLHVCIHGSVWNPNPPFRWAIDAATIINETGSGLDWSRLLEQAEKRRLVLPIREMLAWLRDGLDAPVPPDFLKEMSALPVSKAERDEYLVKMRRMRGLDSLRTFWHTYKRSARRSGIGRKVPEFMRYLQYNWDLDHSYQVPVYMVARVARRNLRKAVSYFNRPDQGSHVASD